jgi:hypothetical protein
MSRFTGRTYEETAGLQGTGFGSHVRRGIRIKTISPAFNGGQSLCRYRVYENVCDSIILINWVYLY